MCLVADPRTPRPGRGGHGLEMPPKGSPWIWRLAACLGSRARQTAARAGRRKMRAAGACPGSPARWGPHATHEHAPAAGEAKAYSLALMVVVVGGGSKGGGMRGGLEPQPGSPSARPRRGQAAAVAARCSAAWRPHAAAPCHRGVRQPPAAHPSGRPGSGSMWHGLPTWNCIMRSSSDSLGPRMTCVRGAHQAGRRVVALAAARLHTTPRQKGAMARRQRRALPHLFEPIVAAAVVRQPRRLRQHAPDKRRRQLHVQGEPLPGGEERCCVQKRCCSCSMRHGPFGQHPSA